MKKKYRNMWYVHDKSPDRHPHQMYFTFCECDDLDDDFFHIYLIGKSHNDCEYSYKTEWDIRSFVSDHPFICHRDVARQIWQELMERDWEYRGLTYGRISVGVDT